MHMFFFTSYMYTFMLVTEASGSAGVAGNNP